MEQKIFCALKFNLGMPSPITFLRRVSKAENEQVSFEIGKKRKKEKKEEKKRKKKIN